MTWMQPWAIGGGPAIPPEVMRQVTFSNPNKSEGILNVGDLRVRATTTASSSILVGSGGAAILNRSAGGTGQSYIARNNGDDIEDVPATSGTSRSDLVVARIVDPQYSPWTKPSNPLTATYIETFIVQNVPSTTTKLRQLNGGAGLGYSAILLARIDRPANQSVISQAQIVDLREVAAPRRQRFLLVKNLSAAENLVAIGVDGQQWPSYPSLNWTVDVPDWATRVRIVAMFSGVYFPANSNMTGNAWARLGSDGDQYHVDTQRSAFDATVGNAQRTTFVVGDDLPIPSGLRDRSVPASLRGRYSSATSVPTASQIKVDGASVVTFDLEFLERATEDA